MGQCYGKNNDAALIEVINHKLQIIDDITKENALLRYRTTKLQMKIENYGMMFSGNPCRITPPSWEVSKRIGYHTV